MLSESSYITAMYVYCGSAFMLLLCLAWWFGRRWPNGWVVLMVLLSAALLLTPAYPRAGAETLAPALIVAGFQIATEGVDTARHALRPLSYACGLAIVLAVAFKLLFLRSKKTEVTDDSGSEEPAG
ncbi:MAG: hypothetical protein ABJN62_14240 [Halioglobus sp.]